MRHHFPYSLLLCLVCPETSDPNTEAPWYCLSLKSYGQPQTGLAGPLEISRILPAGWAHVKVPPVLVGTPFLLDFFLPWEMCLFLASVLAYPVSHTETKKSFHCSSLLSQVFEKLTYVSTAMLTPLSFPNLKLFLFARKIFFLSSLHCPHLILFRILIPSLIMSDDI